MWNLIWNNGGPKFWEYLIRELVSFPWGLIRTVHSLRGLLSLLMPPSFHPLLLRWGRREEGQREREAKGWFIKEGWGKRRG